MTDVAAAPVLRWLGEAEQVLERLARTQAGALETASDVVRGRDRGRRAGAPVRHRPLPHPGRGDVPALRLLPRLQPAWSSCR